MRPRSQPPTEVLQGTVRSRGSTSAFGHMCADSDRSGGGGVFLISWWKFGRNRRCQAKLVPVLLMRQTRVLRIGYESPNVKKNMATICNNQHAARATGTPVIGLPACARDRHLAGCGVPSGPRLSPAGRLSGLRGERERGCGQAKSGDRARAASHRHYQGSVCAGSLSWGGGAVRPGTAARARGRQHHCAGEFR
jgi:hypothetical protein